MTASADEGDGDEISDALIAELQRVADKIGSPPSKSEFDEHSSHNPQTYVSEFGSWVEALKAAELSPEEAQGGREKTDRSDLLQELRRLHDELGEAPRAADMNARGEYSANTYRNRFGSWKEALEEAGISSSSSTKVSREELIDALNALADDLGHPPRPGQMDSSGKYASETYKQRFGSWQEALDEAGFEPFTGVSDEEILQAVSDLADELGRPPTTTEFNNKTPHSATTCLDKFGSWRETLVEAGVDPEPGEGQQQYTDEDLVDELVRLEGELEHTPSTTEMDEEGEYSASVYQQRFGSWEEALDEADLEADDRRQQYSDEELVAALKALQKELGEPPRAVDMQEEGDISPTTFTNRFGSWIEALQEAGIDTKKLENGAQYSRERLIEELQRLADEIGQPPTSTEMEQKGEFSSGVYLQRFDSWDNALEKAELDADEAGNAPQYSDEELMEELRRLAEELDKVPTTTEMEQHGKYSYTTYASRFGSWEKALQEAGIKSQEN